MTAKNPNEQDEAKNTLFKTEKAYFEIGKDLQQRMRYGAWQIKEIIDLTLQPLQTRKEQFLMHFDTDIETVEIEAVLSYYISGGKREEVYSVVKTLEYELE